MRGHTTMRRFLAGSLTGLFLVVGLATTALANHPPTTDSGTDIANVGEAMNQETYWESYFDGEGFSVECTKYEGHNGSIPSSYEAAVVKSGSALVRVYVDPPGQVIGPLNPNAQHPNRRFTSPFSWVMKCDFEQDEETTTTTLPEEDTTTTTLPEEDTTTTTLPDDTTTTTVEVEETTTTTLPEETTTTIPGLTDAPWSGSADCDSITANFGEGIVEVDIISLDTVPGTGEQVGDLDNPFTEPGEMRVRVSTPTAFRLVPVVEDGFIANPDSILVFVPVCEDTTTTTEPETRNRETTPTTTPDVLPFTGSTTENLLALAIGLLTFGGLSLLSVRGRENG